MKLILASGSPRRLQLLQQIGITPKVIISDAEEEQTDLTPELLVQHNALAKARRVAAKVGTETMILGADTVVVLQGKILGKPGTPEKAAAMLRLLSGETHQVLTGVSLLYRNKTLTRVESTLVAMAPLTEAMIARYVCSGEPLDKAGAYAIQGAAAQFIPHIMGSYSNVVGLPLYTVTQMIAEMDGTIDDTIFDQRDAAGRTSS